MYVRCMNLFPTKRFACPSVNRDVGSSDCGQDTGGIGGGTLDRGIAMNGTDAKKVELGVVGSEENGESVLIESGR